MRDVLLKKEEEEALMAAEKMRVEQEEADAAETGVQEKRQLVREAEAALAGVNAELVKLKKVRGCCSSSAQLRHRLDACVVRLCA